MDFYIINQKKMNASSLNETLKQKVGQNCNSKIKKKQTPISLINCTRSIFIKNKPGDIATSYIDGSQTIQNAEKAKRLLMNNFLTQPNAFNQSKNTHLKNQTNIIKTIQTSILSSHRNYNPKTSHSIVNSFTSNPVILNKSKAISKDQRIQEQFNTNNPSINFSRKNTQEKRNSNITFMIKNPLINPSKNTEISNLFVNRNDKGKALKNKLNIRKNTTKTIKSIVNNKQQLNTTTQIETASGSIKETNKSIYKYNHNCLNSIVQNNDSNNTNPQCLTEEDLIHLSKEIKKDNDKSKQEIKKSSDDINFLLKKDKSNKPTKENNKISEIKIQLKKGKNVSITLAPNHQNEIIAEIIAGKTNEEEHKKKEQDNKDKEKEKNKNEVNKPKSVNNENVNKKRKIKAPKCHMRLNLLSLIQENSTKYRTDKDNINTSKCSFEDIDSIIHTDPNQLDSKRFMEFDNFDDINAIIRKINFNVVKKETINIFSDESPTYQQFQDVFNEKYNKIKRYDNSERRTNVSGSTCENSSKKTFIPLSKRDYHMIKTQEV